eukprot:TRINITY_DN546_c0_g1_i13.p1 TRINITY_DN546_c0_g1~~TRINITY_DN546_c0_g1_i13.p1  ORF type:complete len:832 (+),score=211.76 TRINITY_DN546_c0_g1_i13:36-2498(+)
MEAPAFGEGGRSSEGFLGADIIRSPSSPSASPAYRPPPLRFEPAPTSPKSKPRGVRIAVGAEELPHTQGNISRVDLPTLARRLHIPINVLSKSLGTAQPTSSVSINDDDASSIRSRGISIPISPKSSPVRAANSSIGSVREWFPDRSIDRYEASFPSESPIGSPALSAHLSPHDLSRPAVRIRYMSASPSHVISVHCPPYAELGVRWETAAGGLIVAKVHKNSVAAVSGMTEGMRLLQVNGVNVFTKTDFLREFNKPRGVPNIQLTVQTNQHMGSVYTGSPPVSPKSSPQRRPSEDTMSFNEEPVTPNFEDLDDMYFRYTPGGGPESSPGGGPADVEVEVHENGLARLVHGRHDSAYIVNDPHSKGAVFAVADQEGFEAPTYLHQRRQRSLFGSIMGRMSGVLGFGSTEMERSPSQETMPTVKKERHVAFADDAGAELISSVRVYDEIDTVLLELKFIFPKWVWVALFTVLVCFSSTRPLMFSAYEHQLTAHMVLAAQTILEFVFMLLLALVTVPFMKVSRESLSYLWIDRGWAVIVTCGLAHSAARTALLTDLTEYTGCGDDACPPVLLECMVPVFMLFYYTLTRYLEKLRVGQSDEPWFPFEVLGLLLTLVGPAVMLTQQGSGMKIGVSGYALLGALGTTVDLIMRRRVASQMPIPIALFLIHCVSLVFSLVFVVALHRINNDDVHHIVDNMGRLAGAAGMGFAGSLCMMLVLRHMHPYPIASVLCFATVLQVLLSRSLFSVSWDAAGAVAVPVVFTSVIGTLVTTWANVRHRSAMEVEIVQEKRLNRRKAAGHKGPGKRKRGRAPSVPANARREILF